MIREPTLDDAAEIGAAHAAIAKATYPGIADRAKLEALNAESLALRWERIVRSFGEQAARGVFTRCAIDAATGRVAGFATGGAARDEDAPAETELWSLNVIPEHHGRGVAEQLMAAVIPPDENAYLWVARGTIGRSPSTASTGLNSMAVPGSIRNGDVTRSGWLRTRFVVAVLAELSRV